MDVHSNIIAQEAPLVHKRPVLEVEEVELRLPDPNARHNSRCVAIPPRAGRNANEPIAAAASNPQCTSSESGLALARSHAHHSACGVALWAQTRALFARPGASSAFHVCFTDGRMRKGSATAHALNLESTELDPHNDAML